MSCSFFEDKDLHRTKVDFKTTIEECSTATIYNWNPVEEEATDTGREVSTGKLKELKKYLIDDENFTETPFKKNPFLPNLILKFKDKDKTLIIYIAENSLQIKRSSSDENKIFNYDNTVNVLKEMLKPLK